ncbi:MAG: hypothetical protein MHPSP_004622, partial [Paramarteilia canceri]
SLNKKKDISVTIQKEFLQSSTNDGNNKMRDFIKELQNRRLQSISLSNLPEEGENNVKDIGLINHTVGEAK